MIGLIKSFVSPNERELAKARKVLHKILAYEKDVAKLTDEQLRNSTNYFREKLGIDVTKLKGDDIYFDEKYPNFDKKELDAERKKLLAAMPEVYAYVREAAKRVAKHEHFHVQLMTGILLAYNKITEVFTGEGKTNSAVLPAFLYGLTGRGVHIVTVNDYLAKRDGEWAGQILRALGMDASVIVANETFKVISDEEAAEVYGEGVKTTLAHKDMSNMSSMTGTNLRTITKKDAYKADVMYGQANEFGFDYLRDNSAQALEDRVQRFYYYTIVDECDSILIDEARTPLIISIPDAEPSDTYYRFATIAAELKESDDYEVDEKRHSVVLTDVGIAKVEAAFGVKDAWADSQFIKHIDNALKAKALYHNDKEYIVHNGEVLIVDQFTGRVQPGRRFSEGMHQAIEAKERVDIKAESKTLATISFQNFFRMYSYLAGMTGTAMTEAEEFAKIYNIDVVRVPTHKKIIRTDSADVIFSSEKGKYKAVVDEIKQMYEQGRPVLAGTNSIEKSEYLSNLLRKEGIPHQVLNAKLHEKEAKIVANAGTKGTITIATNMAGRGTDIKLAPEVKEIGGLHIIGTERHEARRIDNQLRGRSGRLGDPGSSRFYLSMEDHLMKVFGGDMMKNMLGKQMPDDMPLESGFLSNIVKNAQQKVESMNFDIRKRLVDYDDVLNFQRETVYKMRRLILLLLHNQKLPEFRPFKIDDKDAIKFMQEISNYSLTQHQTSKVNAFVKDTYLDYPLRLWILKQYIDQIFEIIGPDIKPRRVVNEKTGTILTDFLDTCIPDGLQEKAAKDMSFDSYNDLKAKMIEVKKKSAAIDTILLLRLVTSALYIKLEELSKSVPDKDYERYIIMTSLDFLWVDHLDAMSDLREGIGFRGYAQRDPLVEYKREGTILFNQFFTELGDMVSKKALHVEAVKRQQTEADNIELIRNAVQRSMINTGSKKKKKNKK